jgi:hypothetical protein
LPLPTCAQATTPQARGDRSAKMQRFLDGDIDDLFIAHANSTVRLRAKP